MVVGDEIWILYETPEMKENQNNAYIVLIFTETHQTNQKNNLTIKETNKPLTWKGLYSHCVLGPKRSTASGIFRARDHKKCRRLLKMFATFAKSHSKQKKNAYRWGRTHPKVPNIRCSETRLEDDFHLFPEVKKRLGGRTPVSAKSLDTPSTPISKKWRQHSTKKVLQACSDFTEMPQFKWN